MYTIRKDLRDDLSELHYETNKKKTAIMKKGKMEMWHKGLETEEPTFARGLPNTGNITNS